MTTKDIKFLLSLLEGQTFSGGQELDLAVSEHFCHRLRCRDIAIMRDLTKLSHRVLFLQKTRDDQPV